MLSSSFWFILKIRVEVISNEDLHVDKCFYVFKLFLYSPKQLSVFYLSISIYLKHLTSRMVTVTFFIMFVDKSFTASSSFLALLKLF